MFAMPRKPIGVKASSSFNKLKALSSQALFVSTLCIEKSSKIELGARCKRKLMAL